MPLRYYYPALCPLLCFILVFERFLYLRNAASINLSILSAEFLCADTWGALRTFKDFRPLL